MRLALFLLMANLTALADDFEWQQQVHKDGISISLREVDGSKYHEVRATVNIKTKAAPAVALLQDNAACARWVHRCISSEAIEAINETERYFYQVTSLPFPAQSRDAVFRASIEFHANQGIKITLVSAPDRLPETKHVRIIETRGFYHIEPTGSDSILLTWQFYVDPAGALPPLRPLMQPLQI